MFVGSPDTWGHPQGTIGVLGPAGPMEAQPFKEQTGDEETVPTRSVLGGAGVVTRATRSGEGSHIPPLRGGGRRWEELSVQCKQGPGECRVGARWGQVGEGGGPGRGGPAAPEEFGPG